MKDISKRTRRRSLETISYSKRVAHIKMLEHRNSYMSILEISTKAGARASTILHIVSGTEEEVARFERYTYKSPSLDNWQIGNFAYVTFSWQGSG